MSLAAAGMQAAATVAGAAIAADAAKKGGGGQVGTQTVTTAPPSYIAPQYSRVATEGESLYDRGLFGDIQTLSPYERRLVEAGMARAETGSPFQAAGERAVQSLLSGDSLVGEAADIYRGVAGGPSSMASPAFQAAAQRQVEQALRPLTSQFARGGRLGSGLFASEAGEAAAEALSPMMYKAQQQDIANRLSAAQGLLGASGAETQRTGIGLDAASAVGQMPFTDIQKGLALGGLLSGEEYALSQAPVTGLQRYTDFLKGATVGEQATRPLYGQAGPTSGQIIGAGLMASAPQIGQAFSNYMNRPEGQVIQGTGNFTLPDGTTISGTTGFAMP